MSWRRLLVLLAASGAFAMFAIPSSRVRAHDEQMALKAREIDLQHLESAFRGGSEPPLQAAPRAECGPGSRPETGLQGRVSSKDHASGRAAKGFTCNTRLVGKYTKPTPLKNTDLGIEDPQGTVGGFRVHRYVDDAGHECAYYDTTLLFPTNIFDALAGVNVMDMSDPANPVLTERLVTPAMLSPHESLNISEKRGLLAAVTGNPAFLPGVLDVYDISEDCRHPVLRSSTPTAVLGHESGMAPDGRTFYSGSAAATLVAIDISNPSLPVPLAALDVPSHGLTLSDDGNRAYVAATVGDDAGLIVLDTSEIQARQPSPQFREVSRLSWKSMSIPQNAIPIVIDGHPYVVEIDEFGTLSEVGAGRLIDIKDETKPRVVSNLRLEVHQPKNFDKIGGDPGADNPVGGYSGHYCGVPRPVNPRMVACSMGVSGLRVFDIRDPKNPREVAYFNAPVTTRIFPGGSAAPEGSNYALSQPTFVPERREVWYSDGYSGFFAVRLTNGVWSGGDGDGSGNGGGDSNGGRPGGDDGDSGGGDDIEGGDEGGEEGEDTGAETARSDGQASPNPGPSPSATTADDGSLPFTGLEIGVLLAAALALLGVGIALRRNASQT